MKTARLILFWVFCFTCLQVSSLDGSEQISVLMSEPGKPGLVSLSHYKGSITVSGYDGDSVVVTASYRPVENPSGMKLLAGPPIRLSATENANTVIISTNSFRRTIDLDLRVPRYVSLKLSTEDNGEILVRDVDGAMELNNTNGSVKLIHVAGSAIVSTIDGDIYADFVRVDPGQPMVFSTIEGGIDLGFPGNADFSLKMRTDYGQIFSDFAVDLAQRKMRVEKNKNSGSTKVSLDDWTFGKVNRGGAEYLIKTLNGDIYIREKK